MAGTDVLIVCEAGQGQTESANAMLTAKGLDLAEHWGGKLVCLLMGHGIEAKAAELSGQVDEVYLADSPLHAHYHPHACLKVAEAVVENLRPKAVLFGHTYIGMDLAPRLASRLGVELASNCFDVKVEDGAARFVRPLYRGRVHAKVAMDFSPMVATLQLGKAEPRTRRGPGVVRRMHVEPEGEARIRPIRTMEPALEGLDITKAEIVVAGGRGIGAKENFKLVSDLAEALGGVSACSRPLVDMGWVGADRQVGLSGKTVKPKLYVACGVSGAVEHVQGMKESEIIVAINNDPGAPIFRIAHCGVVGDLNDVLPYLIREVRAARAGKDSPLARE